MPSRRDFLASVSLLPAVGLTAELGAAVPAASPQSQAPRPLGVAPDASHFLFSPGLVYLQTGSLGPTPRPVFEQVLAAWKELESNPVHFGFGPHERQMEEVRATAAAFLGCKTEELVLTRSTTEGMNYVAQGLALSAGDHVLTTDQEHPGGRVGWDYCVRRQGIVLDIVQVAPTDHDPQAIVDRFRKALTPRTRVLCFSHVLTSTGLRMPVAELSALARSHSCLAVVDGAQALGAIQVNVKALGCHVYVACGHKWVLGPKGTGVLYLSDEIGRTVDPIALQEGRAAYSGSSGVTSIPSVLGLGASMKYLGAIGTPRIEAHNLRLRERLYTALQDVKAVRVASAPPGPMASPLLSYVLPPGVKSDEMYRRLFERHHVVVKVVPGQWLNGHRISTHLFNTEEDVDRFVEALRQELKQG